MGKRKMMSGLHHCARARAAGLFWAGSLWLLAGCASLPDNPAAGVSNHLGGNSPDFSVAEQQRLRALLATPLGATDTVRIALANNAGIRSAYASLGIAAADVYDAGRLTNPGLHVSVLGASGASETTVGITQAFTDLLLLGSRRRRAQGEFRRLELVVAHKTKRLAARAESAFFDHVGAKQVARMRNRAALAASISAELAQSFFDAGNIGELQLKREQAAAARAKIKAMEADLDVVQTKSRLGAIMGLEDGLTWTTTRSLPEELPGAPALRELLRIALESRLDLKAVREEIRLLTRYRNLSRRTRFLGSTEIGIEAQSASGESTLVGPTFSLELPIFNQGKGRVARAQAGLQQARADHRLLQGNISAAVRSVHAQMEHHRSTAEQYRNVLLPAREAIVERLQEHVNFMLKSQFELLAAKQEQIDGLEEYAAAVRGYWMARAALVQAIGAPLPASSPRDSLVEPKSVDSHKNDQQHKHHGEKQ